MRSAFAIAAVFSSVAAHEAAAATASNALAASTQSRYFWDATAVGSTAELNTLFCRGCNPAAGDRADIPLLSVLRDTLGDDTAANDRLTEVWLLTYTRPTIARRMLSAVPFFYWHVASRSERAGSGRAAPLLDLTAPHNPMINAVSRDVLQWTTFDTAGTPIRALSHAYRTNEVDDERLHLAEAINYLRQAPAGDSASGLSSSERNLLIARLELRKSVLGGLVRERAAENLGERTNIDFERTRARNWELLRQCADKVGLYFEPLDLAATSGQYAMLWLPLDSSPPTSRTQVKPIWRLLNLKDPSPDAADPLNSPRTYTRDFDNDGRLLAEGVSGVIQRKLVPLGVYSLNYPKLPLLMVDFRSQQHLRWHTVAQRSINEVTAGVIGISHFTNWYYYVGADLYNFVVSRRGSAVNDAQRLDCYSQFRVDLELDSQLDPELRERLQQRVDSLSVNPLEATPQEEMQAAAARFKRLQAEAADGRLATVVDKHRRAELASVDRSNRHSAQDSILHVLSMGTYTNRVKASAQNVAEADHLRRAEMQLRYLDQLAAKGTQPEVISDSARISQAIAELQELVPLTGSTELKQHAAETLAHIRELSQDGALRSDCEMAMLTMRESDPGTRDRVALKPSAIEVPAFAPTAAPSALK